MASTYQYPSFISSSKASPLISFSGGTVMPLKVVEPSAVSVELADSAFSGIDGFIGMPKTSSSTFAGVCPDGGAAKMGAVRQKVATRLIIGRRIVGVS